MQMTVPIFFSSILATAFIFTLFRPTQHPSFFPLLILTIPIQEFRTQPSFEALKAYQKGS